MRATSSIVALAALAGMVAGCAQETYYPRYGYSQAYYQPSGYSYYQPSGYSYYQATTSRPATTIRLAMRTDRPPTTRGPTTTATTTESTPRRNEPFPRERA